MDKKNSCKPKISVNIDKQIKLSELQIELKNYQTSIIDISLIPHIRKCELFLSVF